MSIATKAGKLFMYNSEKGEIMKSKLEVSEDDTNKKKKEIT